MAVPDQGDLVWVDFNPQAGHEQSGRRPALVLSPKAYHEKTNYAVVCPITSTVKGYPFETTLPTGLVISGAVLADQVKSIDRNVRNLEIADRAPPDILSDVLSKISALLDLS
tara:strand:- start:1022 stop:1357 length:336 start_codon:yes stop_codon:yes gene_type:complete